MLHECIYLVWAVCKKMRTRNRECLALEYTKNGTPHSGGVIVLALNCKLLYDHMEPGLCLHAFRFYMR